MTTNAEAWNEQGNILFDCGQFAGAIDCYREAINLEPIYADAHNNLGIALFAQGHLIEAAESFRQALRINPNYANALNNLGNTLKNQGQVADAAECYRQALRINPNHANAHNNLGKALREMAQPGEAAECFRQALRINPNYADAHINLGNALQDQGQPAEAAECYRQALCIASNHAVAHYNLGNALVAQGQLALAADAFRQALRFDPTDANAHHNLGNVLVSQEELADAVVCYRRALDLQPANPTFLIHLIHQLQHLCFWDDQADLAHRVIAAVETATPIGVTIDVPPFPFLVLPVPTTAAQQLCCARLQSLKLTKNLADRGAGLEPASLSKRADKTKITLGYLSADFHGHATAHLIAELFELHDRTRFDVFGYSLGPDDGSAMRRRLVSAFDRFTDLRDASDSEAAKRIRDDKVDILIDLNGYAGHNRTSILVLRPAPVQVNYLGYPGTMGAAFMDYILVDEFIVPPGRQPFFTERLAYLPGCYQVNDRQRAIDATTPTRLECGLPERGVVFCDFNNSYKITPRMFDVWMNLLKAVPGSVLWLLEGNRFAAANLRREAEARGVAAARLVFAPRKSMPEHLARHRLADLFLDTFPVCAHTSASDALWAGCPVLTLAGETFVSRVAGSILTTIGLSELVTYSFEEYEALALRLAKNPVILADLRARLAVNRGTGRLFDAERFARELERAYVAMITCRVGQAYSR